MSDVPHRQRLKKEFGMDTVRATTETKQTEVLHSGG